MTGSNSSSTATTLQPTSAMFQSRLLGCTDRHWETETKEELQGSQACQEEGSCRADSQPGRVAEKSLRIAGRMSVRARGKVQSMRA